MELRGEEILKKAKKMPKWIKIGYIICILAIIVVFGLIVYKEETQTPTPIDFTTNGAIGMAKDQYAYLKVEGLTDVVAIYGYTDNEQDDTNDRYFIALSGGYMYIVNLDMNAEEQLKAIQDYTYSTDENAEAPTPQLIYGMTEEIPVELKQYVIDYYNQMVSEEHQLTVDEFEMYFGDALLNVKRDPVNVNLEAGIILIAIFVLFILFITHIITKVNASRIKKYIKNNDYESDIASQLDDNVEEKYYKDKVIITKDYYVETRGGLKVFKFSDVKWVHIHNVKYYGVIKTNSSIIVHLKDGKTNIQCLSISGKETEEFMKVFEKICAKIPADALKGYTSENIREFKEYKKELKRNI